MGRGNSLISDFATNAASRQPSTGSPTDADVILIIGPPGAGKGTLAPRITSHFSASHISTGDIFREAIASGSEIGKFAASLINDGNLVPDDVTIKIVQEALPEGPVLLDGFPRSLPQAKALDEMVKSMNRRITHVIWVDVPDEALYSRTLNRLLCESCGAPNTSSDASCNTCGGELYKRADDTSESLKKRLSVYHADTEPIAKEHYSQAFRIDGSGTVENGQRQLDAYLGSK